MAHTYTYTDPPPDTTAAPLPPSNTPVAPPIPPSSNPERTGTCNARGPCDVADANCFHQQDGIIKMGDGPYSDAIHYFCTSIDGLNPSDPGTFITWNTTGPGDFGMDPTMIVLRTDWAEDQTGCGEKKTFWFSHHNEPAFVCAYAWKRLFNCGNKPLESYGGWYIKNTTDSGCLKFSLYAVPIVHEVGHFAVGFNGSADNSTMVSGMGGNGSHLISYRAA
ncbi:hypothetical protein LTR15_011634 [Elasticomyces elasticus]|nr:hypothetical protein LTR15_011634 [Elasticomyces elasticus]